MAESQVKRKRGRPAKQITPETIAKIEKLAGLGCRLEEIAIACDVSTSTLERWKQKAEVKTAYEKGRIHAKEEIAQRLYDLALSGDVAALIFWLKAQAGWTDKPQPEPEQNAAQVIVYIPENNR
jgi:transposase